MPSDTSGYPADFQKLIDSYNIASDTLMEQLEAGKLTPKQWEKTMQATLGKYGQAAMLLGSGEGALSESQSGNVRTWLGDQMSYLKNFAKVVTGDFNPAWKPRARMYGASTYTEYWEGKTEGLALPAQPAQGTACLCVTTGESRIVTAKGLVEIKNIKVGDFVLTHLGRWRKVTATYLRSSTPTHQQAWVTSPWGTRVGCTSDHRFLTQDGWKQAMYIDNSHDKIYNINHENILQIVRNTFGESIQNGLMPELSPDLSLREVEGLQSGGMHFMRNEPQGENPMAGTAREYSGRDSSYVTSQVEDLRKSDIRSLQFSETGWKIFHILSRLEREDTLHIPLSMGMDTSLRSDTERSCCSSFERGSNRRQAREFGNNDSRETCKHSHDNGAQAETCGECGSDIYGENTRGGNVRLDLPELREGISQLQTTRDQRPQVLLAGMLHPGTVLFDLEIEDDHSFIVEGLISHNSNCRCSWEIKWIDKKKGDADAYWRLSAVEHCQTCLARAEMWNPIRIRGGDLQGDVSALAKPKPPKPSKSAAVSNAFDYDQSILGGKIKSALDAINGVHKDGALPKIKMDLDNSPNSSSQGSYGQYDHDGSPGDILINKRTKQAEFTAAHEIGHFIDHAGLGNGGFKFASEIPGGEMSGWSATVQNSAAYKTLVSKKLNPGNYKVSVTTSSGKASFGPNVQQLEYLLDVKELWARSYAQYIAIKSGNKAMLSQLKTQQNDILYGERQWSKADFKPIMDEIDKLFKAKGWL